MDQGCPRGFSSFRGKSEQEQNLTICGQVSLKQVLETSGFPYVAVSPLDPHEMCLASCNFFAKFKDPFTTGQPLRLVVRPDSQSRVTSLLKFASIGHIVRSTVQVSTLSTSLENVEEEILCAPVHEKSSGSICLLLVALIPIQPNHTPESKGKTYWFDPIWRIHSMATSLHEPTPLLDEPSNSASTYPHEIFPRRKPGAERKGAPVLLTPDLLVALSHLRLSHAAQAVGISVTAFKKACRKLGVARWSYTRGASKRGQLSPQDIAHIMAVATAPTPAPTPVAPAATAFAAALALPWPMPATVYTDQQRPAQRRRAPRHSTSTGGRPALESDGNPLHGAVGPAAAVGGACSGWRRIANPALACGGDDDSGCGARSGGGGAPPAYTPPLCGGALEQVGFDDLFALPGGGPGSPLTPPNDTDGWVAALPGEAAAPAWAVDAAEAAACCAPPGWPPLDDADAAWLLCDAPPPAVL